MVQVLGAWWSPCCAHAGTSTPLLARALPAGCQAFRAAPAQRPAARKLHHGARRSAAHASTWMAALSNSGNGSAPLEKLLEVAVRAAQAGAAVVSERVDKPRSIEFKGATDLVTDTDKASEEAVLTVLREAFPGHALLGEEGGVEGDTSSQYLWCIDPLDGTTNFAHSYPCFSVSAAVLQSGEPVAGAVVEFSGGPGAWVTKTYSAAQGQGATLNGSPISVSREADVKRSLLVTGFGYEHDEAWEANLELFREFTDISRGVRRLGSAAADLCHVALGVADAYWEYRLKPWDMAAGVIIAREAGATITTMEGQPFSVFSRSVLAANPHIHPAIVARTQTKTEGLRQKGVDLSPWFVPEGYRVPA